MIPVMAAEVPTALPQGRYECIWISLLISWVLGAVMTVACYRMGRWKKTALGG